MKTRVSIIIWMFFAVSIMAGAVAVATLPTAMAGDRTECSGG